MGDGNWGLLGFIFLLVFSGFTVSCHFLWVVIPCLLLVRVLVYYYATTGSPRRYISLLLILALIEALVAAPELMLMDRMHSPEPLPSRSVGIGLFFISRMSAILAPPIIFRISYRQGGRDVVHRKFTYWLASWLLNLLSVGMILVVIMP